MKKYEVRVWQVTWEHCDVTVEAEDENKAKALAYEKATDGITEWILDSTETNDIDILKEV